MTTHEQRSCRAASTCPLLILLILGFAAVHARGAGHEPAAPAGASASEKSPFDSSAAEYFEKSVRPILVARCLSCHGSEKQKGGLRLDARAAILAGGSTGPAVVPGSPKESLLVDAINYGESYQMPPKSKLSAAEIATLTDWVEKGAPWGVETPGGPLNRSKGQEGGNDDRLPAAVLAERAKYWSFQPIRRRPPPDEPHAARGWAQNPIDRFILAGLADRDLSPAPAADKRTLIRRVSFDLIGLPPSPLEVAAFLADSSPDAYERVVDRLLASPRHGERTARHWLDLVRFAETAGHEFDYDIPNAFRYRDYVIRAFNSDVPYHQFVIEHIAGDLLPAPRRHPVAGFNESIIGTGFFFLGEGTHSPVDVREDEMRRIDNQIDVISKAVLGLTVACARCHDHKFDPITAADYYALAGFLRGSRHQQAAIDPAEPVLAAVKTLRRLKEDVVRGVQSALPLLPKPLQSQGSSFPWPSAAPSKPLASPAPAAPVADHGEVVFEDFERDRFDGWYVSGEAFGDGPSRDGAFRLAREGPSLGLIAEPSGVAHSGLDAGRLHGVLRSRSFTIEARYIHTLARGRGGKINVVVDGYEKIREPIYGGLSIAVNHGDQPRWLTQDVGMWLGHSAYIELADGSTVDFQGASTHVDSGQGYLAVDEIRMSNGPPPSASGREPVSIDLAAVIAALKSAPTSEADRLADRITAALDQTIAAERAIPEPTLALAAVDGTGVNERIHIRGNHRSLGPVVPRRFLEVLGGSATSTIGAGSGRLELVHCMVDPATNPLVPRVVVNRLWKHLFGEGIVRSTDDFGAMGRKPSHPELLDWLASEFIAGGWSIKAMERLMVTSSTYRMSSVLRPHAEAIDPTNTYLHRMNVRRLEAEAIRDTLLSVSGRLEPTMYGPSVPPHLTTFMDGRGRPAQSGPLDGDGRRSIYLNVRRNFLNPMLLAFDMPAPFSTMGRRNVSNVPAQALTLMNDPMVVAQARIWAQSALDQAAASPRARLDSLYLTAFARLPTDQEARASLDFLDGQGHTLDAWADLCHVLINTKEFIFVD